MTTRTLAIVSMSAVIALSVIIGVSSWWATYTAKPLFGENGVTCIYMVESGYDATGADRLLLRCSSGSRTQGIRDGAIALLVGSGIVLLALRRGKAGSTG